MAFLCAFSDIFTQYHPHGNDNVLNPIVITSIILQYPIFLKLNAFELWF